MRPLFSTTERKTIMNSPINASRKMTNSDDSFIKSERPRWGAVFAMALCVAVLIASEFMPVSLLSPIAHDLGLTEGQAGQAIAISGIFAVLTSLFIIPVAVVALIWQTLTLPRLPAENDSDAKGMLKLFRNRTVALGMVAVMLSFMGQFALFTYLRPFLEQVTGVNVSMLTWMLLIVGLTGLIGTSFVSRFLDGRLHTTLVVIPAVMGAVAIPMAALGRRPGVPPPRPCLWG